MKPLILMMSCLVCAGALANAQYDDASKYAAGLKGQGMSTLKGTNPTDVIPGYTADAPESTYYGGVTATSSGSLDNAGASALNTTDAGKLLQDVVKNRPADPISPDAPFISKGLDVEQDAENIMSGTDTQCKAVDVNQQKITNYTCERSPAVSLTCTRDASIGGQYVPSQVQKDITLTNANFTFVKDGGYVRADFTVPETGTVLSGEFDFALNTSTHGFTQSTTISVLGGQATVPKYGNGTYPVSVSGVSLTAGQTQSVTFYVNQSQHHDTFTNAILNNLQSGSATFTLRLVMMVQGQAWQPQVDWTENCPFDKSEQVLADTQCTDPGGDRQVTVDGQQYTVHSDCWQYTDTYLTQSSDNGTCGEYMNNAACTVSRTTCLESVGSTCLREQAIFSCETDVTGSAQVCGSELVCTDGSCDQLENSKTDSFQSAVSGLAALAAAGKDVSAMNGVNVSAFTGEAKSCRKAMAGFSNCCKDSGWGQDAGLTSCDSDEKALAAAKSRKLSIYVGSYCAHKVLGVCLEKKEGYCQFDSKLAKIIQEQGRRGQLGISFGNGESPNCRGITVDELKNLKFDQMNFADFYSDLENGTTLPADQTLIDSVKEQVAAKMQEAGK